MILTKSEMEIMDVLWLSEKPMSRSDILESSTDKTWKDSSVHILLNGLLKKGMIQEAGFVKRSKTYGRTFTPAMTREQYFAMSIFSYKYKPVALDLVEAIVNREEVSKEALTKIKAMIEALLAD